MFSGTQLAIAACLACTLGCDGVVVIASECASSRRQCEQMMPATTPGLADDASTPDGNPDGGRADPGTDDGGRAFAAAGYPPIVNGSLEPPDGSSGAVLVWESGDAIEPWRACGVGALSAPTGEFRPLSPTVEPSDGEYLVYANVATGAVSPVELAQTLSEPLEPGVEYNLAVDLRSSGSNWDSIELLVFGGDGNCSHEEALFVSDEVNASAEWVTVCVSFMPESSHDAIILEPRFSSVVSSASTWYIDNVRPAGDDCP